MQLPELDAWIITMDQGRRTLRTVGVVLIVVGAFALVFDIIAIVEAFTMHAGFSIGVEALAAWVGVLMYQGNAKYVRQVAYFAGMFSTGGLVAMLIGPFLIPLDYILWQIQLLSIGWLLCLAFIPLCFWVYARLTSPEVEAVVSNQFGPNVKLWQDPRVGIFVGALIATVALGTSALVESPLLPDNQHTLENARKKAGPGYACFISAYQNDQKTITCYNRRDGKTVTIPSP